MRRKERYAVVRYGLGHDPYTYEVSDHSQACMASMARAQRYCAEDVTELSGIIPVSQRTAVRPLH